MKEAYRSAQAVRWADQLYRRTRTRAQRARVWSVLTGHRHSLLQLSAVEVSCRVRSRYWAGMRTVPISGKKDGRN